MTPAESILPDSLVTTDWLEDHLYHPALRVVDIRGYVRTTDLGKGPQHADYVGARDEYERRHIPGAVFVDWTTDITDPDNPVKAQIAPPARFAEAMGRIGVGDETDVVAVDHTGGHFATRLWWALRYHGHYRVAVLDGGYAKWQAEGRPTTADVTDVAPASFTPRVDPSLRVEAAEVEEAAGRPDTLIVDARDEQQYRGETRRGPRGGHVPTAISLSAKRLFTEQGTWRPVDEVRDLLRASGVESDRRVVAYCNGGVTATAVLFALHRAERGNWANYDGSWNEWGERFDLPVREGNEP